MNVLFIDNFDSFTFNLVDELRKRGARVDVWRNDVPAETALAMAQALPEPRLIVLSPGPGAPADAGCCIPLIRMAAGIVPVFGVCLGHQAIVEAFAGTVGFAGEVVHGKASWIEHDGVGLFEGLPSPFRAARCGPVVMGIEHRRFRIAGVQFHPESILTPAGGPLIERLVKWAGAKQETIHA